MSAIEVRDQGAAPQDSVDRARAAFAYECIAQTKDALGDKAEAYRGLTEKLPAMIQTNGLGSTLAFLAAKGADSESGRAAKPEQRLYNDIEAWLTRCERPSGPYSERAPGETGSRGLALLQRLTAADGLSYRRATLETLALAAWLKRLSGALIPKEAKANHGPAT